MAFVRSSLLAALCLAGAAHAEKAPSASDPCFKSVFKKTVQQQQWQVFECMPENPTAVTVYYRASLKRADGSQQESGVIAAEPQLQTDYHLHGGDLLQLDFVSERNGSTAFLHPVAGDGKALSMVRFDYQTGDEESLQVVRKGQQLSFKPARNKMKVNIQPDGQLQLLKR